MIRRMPADTAFATGWTLGCIAIILTYHEHTTAALAIAAIGIVLSFILPSTSSTTQVGGRHAIEKTQRDS